MSKSLVFSFARMNPPTKGHEILINKVLQISKETKSDHIIVISHSNDPIRNPLDQKTKLFYLKEFFPRVNFATSSPEEPSIIEHLKKYSSSYDRIKMVGGFDRLNTFRQLTEKYNGVEYNYDSIEIIECGNLTTRELYSGTLARNLARSREIKYILEIYSSLYEKIELEDIIKQIYEKGEKKDLNMFIDICPDHKLKFKLLIDLVTAINTFEASKKVNRGREKV